MLVNELFEALNKAVPFEVTHVSDTSFIANFTVANRNLQFSADRDGKKTWELVFSEMKRTKDEYGSFYLKHTFNKTGSGGEFEVFATLKAIIEKFISVKKPEVMYFSSDKEDVSRATLYHALSRRFKPAGYKFVLNPDNIDVYLPEEHEIFAFFKDQSPKAKKRS